LEVWDIAGLVKGAHEGRGLGNEFFRKYPISRCNISCSSSI